MSLVYRTAPDAIVLVESKKIKPWTWWDSFCWFFGRRGPEFVFKRSRRPKPDDAIKKTRFLSKFKDDLEIAANDYQNFMYITDRTNIDYSRHYYSVEERCLWAKEMGYTVFIAQDNREDCYVSFNGLPKNNDKLA